MNTCKPHLLYISKYQIITKRHIYILIRFYFYIFFIYAFKTKEYY
jgi:hypothetical protein